VLLLALAAIAMKVRPAVMVIGYVWKYQATGKHLQLFLTVYVLHEKMS